MVTKGTCFNRLASEQGKQARQANKKGKQAVSSIAGKQDVMGNDAHPTESLTRRKFYRSETCCLPNAFENSHMIIALHSV